ncbi:MAG: GNAT family N-acetyltransferase [Gammaproteobacteria bacterium]|nr:GNAT family N-acetyltransferase [Pseudomonadales bacterium]
MEFSPKRCILSPAPQELVFQNSKFNFRPICETDLEDLYTWRTDPLVGQFLASAPPASLDDQIAWYRRYLDDESSLNFIVSSTTNAARRFGYCQLLKIDMDEKCLEIGSVVAVRELLGLGVGYAQATSLLTICFDQLGMKTIYANNHPENDGSNRLHAEFWRSTRIDYEHSYKKDGQILFSLTKRAFEEFATRISQKRARWKPYFETIPVV